MSTSKTSPTSQSRESSPGRSAVTPIRDKVAQHLREKTLTMYKNATDEQKIAARMWVKKGNAKQEDIDRCIMEGKDIAMLAFYDRVAKEYRKSEQQAQKHKKLQLQQRLHGKRGSFSKEEFEALLNGAVVTSEQKAILLRGFEQQQIRKLQQEEAAARQGNVDGQQGQMASARQLSAAFNNSSPPTMGLDAASIPTLGARPSVMQAHDTPMGSSPASSIRTGSSPSFLTSQQINPYGLADPITAQYPGRPHHFSYEALLARQAVEAQADRVSPAQTPRQAGMGNLMAMDPSSSFGSSPYQARMGTTSMASLDPTGSLNVSSRQAGMSNPMGPSGSFRVSPHQTSMGTSLTRMAPATSLGVSPRQAGMGNSMASMGLSGYVGVAHLQASMGSMGSAPSLGVSPLLGDVGSGLGLADYNSQASSNTGSPNRLPDYISQHNSNNGSPNRLPSNYNTHYNGDAESPSKRRKVRHNKKPGHAHHVSAYRGPARTSSQETVFEGEGGGETSPVRSNASNAYTGRKSSSPDAQSPPGSSNQPFIGRIMIYQNQPNFNHLFCATRSTPYRSPYGKKDFNPNVKALLSRMKQDGSYQRLVTPPRCDDQLQDNVVLLEEDLYQALVEALELPNKSTKTAAVAQVTNLPDTPPISEPSSPSMTAAASNGVSPPISEPSSPSMTAAASNDGSKSPETAPATQAYVSTIPIPATAPLKFTMPNPTPSVSDFLPDQYAEVIAQLEGKQEELKSRMRTLPGLDAEKDGAYKSGANKAAIKIAVPTPPAKKSRITQFLFPGDNPVIYDDEKFPGSFVLVNGAEEWNPTYEQEEEFEDWCEEQGELEDDKYSSD